MQGTRVQSLVGELRSHMPCGAAKKLKLKLKKDKKKERKLKKEMPFLMGSSLSFKSQRSAAISERFILKALSSWELPCLCSNSTLY